MSISYRAVDWNRHKRYYDAALAAFVLLSITSYISVAYWLSPEATAETLVIRGCAFAAIVLLHVILCIGPLSRFDARFLPLLYNRRHLGVSMFGLGLVHAAFATFQFHALGNENPLVSVLTAYGRDYHLVANGRAGIGHFPFEPFGAAALMILFLMAATSHDFWLKNLGASFWKVLHLGVYLAYGLLIAHVALGALQFEQSPAYPVMLAASLAMVAGLHLAAAIKERSFDSQGGKNRSDGFVDVCAVAEVDEARGKVVVVEGQRLALFRHQGRLFATSNVCRHQGGPVGEGRIVDGCITCPWHGWNYRPEDGCSPPPFHEVLLTYETRVAAGRAWIRPRANPLGTKCDGAPVPSPSDAGPAIAAREAL